MHRAIYVPGTSVANASWLANSFFLWDKLYAIVPPSITPTPTGLETALRHECGFIENSDYASFISTADDNYIDAVNGLQCTDRLEQPDLKPLIDDEAVVWVYKHKVNDAIVTCWQNHDFIKKERQGKYAIPRFWADLWLVTLAREMGRRDKIHPVTDLLKTEKIIRTSYELDENVDRAALNDQMKGVFLKFGLPVPTLEGINTEKPDLNVWKSIKADLAGVRSEYHKEVEVFLEQVPVFLKSDECIFHLVRETRELLKDKIAHRWSKSFSAAGWKMFGASASILFAGIVEPEFLKSALLASAATHFVYMLGEFRATRHQQQRTLLYEYQLGQRLAT